MVGLVRTKRCLIALFIMTAGSATVWSQNSTTVDWHNSATTLLRDAGGNPLPQGSASSNSDGMLVQLGYFTSATTANKFSGTWTPLTGAGGRPRTAIGDSFNLLGSGNGALQFNTFFLTGTATIEVYDLNDSGHYQTQSSVGIWPTTPPNSQILGIRFYDTPDGQFGYYNTVSSDTWRWKTPTASGSVVQIDLSSSTLAFQDPNNPLLTAIPVGTPAQLVNISSRLSVGTGDNVLIGGFIITGADQKKLIVRAIGPSLTVPGALADPALQLFDESGALIASNDNWRSTQQQEIINTTIPPPNDNEAAIVTTLSPGAYTSVVRGVNDSTGTALVEVYDLARNADSRLGNISTRGFVQTGDNVLVGGVIVLGEAPLKVIIRAIGPSLLLDGRLANPTLGLFDDNGSALGFNDNWRESQQAEIMATTIPPQDDLESAIVATLTAANYTAVVRGAQNSTGIAVVEVYALQ
jgi:hypothetical protein